MNWTKKLPTEPGFYWWRDRLGDKPYIVEISAKSRVYVPGISTVYRSDSYGGQWYGPLIAPGGDAIENCWLHEQDANLIL